MTVAVFTQPYLYKPPGSGRGKQVRPSAAPARANRGNEQFVSWKAGASAARNDS
ncbi:MAG: hypothetical protein WAM21_20430 [Steroidobacteraceae bacterium]